MTLCPKQMEHKTSVEESRKVMIATHVRQFGLKVRLQTDNSGEHLQRRSWLTSRSLKNSHVTRTQSQPENPDRRGAPLGTTKQETVCRKIVTFRTNRDAHGTPRLPPSIRQS